MTIQGPSDASVALDVVKAALTKDDGSGRLGGPSPFDPGAIHNYAITDTLDSRRRDLLANVGRVEPLGLAVGRSRRLPKLVGVRDHPVAAPGIGGSRFGERRRACLEQARFDLRFHPGEVEFAGRYMEPLAGRDRAPEAAGLPVETQAVTLVAG